MKIEDAETREALQQRYLTLTRETLPSRARAEGWIVHFDHCFMRILLDHLFEDEWYGHLSRKQVAYKQLSIKQLQAAIHMGEAILKRGNGYLRELNCQSLRWRGKVP